MKYDPWGAEFTVTSNDRDKFGTYYRDSTGLNYAEQRYYGATGGRFLSADPYVASAGAGAPGSWNRYVYVEGDPVNANDPKGLYMAIIHYEDGFAFGKAAGMGDLWGGNAPSHPVGPAPVSPDAGVGSGGGGGGAPGIRERITSADKARDLLGQTIDKLNAECRKALGKKANSSNNLVGFASVRNHIQNLTFHDGRQEGFMSLAGGSDTTSFAEYHAGRPSTEATVLLNGRGVPSNHVVLWHDFFGNNKYPRPLIEQQVTLIHELIHSYFNQGAEDHSDVIRGLVAPTGSESNSDALNRWITECLQ